MAGEFKEIDKRLFLELLQDYRSEDYKKARRNLMSVPIIIVLSQVLNLDFNKITVVGLPIGENTNLFYLHGLGFVLLIYWIVLFSFHRVKDKKLQETRKHILDSQVNHYRGLLFEVSKLKEKHGLTPGSYYANVEADVTPLIKEFDNQEEKTKGTKFWFKWTDLIEFCVPILLTFYSLAYFAYFFYQAK